MHPSLGFGRDLQFCRKTLHIIEKYLEKGQNPSNAEVNKSSVVKKITSFIKKVILGSENYSAHEDPR